MGGLARKRRADKKKELKRQVKQQRRALYASLAGTSKKKKRQNPRKKITAQRGNHVMSDCGNVGCEKCYPQHQVLRANESSRKSFTPVKISD